MNLGIVQAAHQQFNAAEQSYKTALRHRRRYPDCLYNLGNLVISCAVYCLHFVVFFIDVDVF